MDKTLISQLSQAGTQSPFLLLAFVLFGGGFFVLSFVWILFGFLVGWVCLGFLGGEGWKEGEWEVAFKFSRSTSSQALAKEVGDSHDYFHTCLSVFGTNCLEFFDSQEEILVH